MAAVAGRFITALPLAWCSRWFSSSSGRSPDRRAKRNSSSINSKRTGAVFFSRLILTTMKLPMKTVTHVLGILAAATLTQALAQANDAMTSPASTAMNTRYGLFDGLDHRSSYGHYFFPEPLLVGESDVDNEVR